MQTAYENEKKVIQMEAVSLIEAMWNSVLPCSIYAFFSVGILNQIINIQEYLCSFDL